ncbi:MAG: 3-phosphoshikimate 1-carboxyvinyltransferase, partial [Paracoccus sp. (in: a-proteobacteria)]|nr:3-phosphoshikimate 1-carboxyvinyltransferase [Paracoccus sp. (in: a-proteobacteria)]
VIEAEPTRDHSERMLAGFGAEIRTEITDEGHVITLTGRPELSAQSVAVPRDPSSAAFAVAAAAIVPGSEIRVEGISRNPTRDGFYITLEEMGADLTWDNAREEGGEPVADLTVRHAKLRGADVPAGRAVSMIDEFPILAVVAAFADGDTVMNGVAELRVKESDRIDAMAKGLRANGARVSETEDSMTVHGKGRLPGGGAPVATHLDHRIAMSFLVGGLAADAPVRVDDGAAIATSFPDFVTVMQALGADLG